LGGESGREGSEAQAADGAAKAKACAHAPVRGAYPPVPITVVFTSPELACGVNMVECAEQGSPPQEPSAPGPPSRHHCTPAASVVTSMPVGPTPPVNVAFSRRHVWVGRDGSHAATTATLSERERPRVVLAGVYTATRRPCTPRGSWLMLMASALPTTARKQVVKGGWVMGGGEGEPQIR
jgi:hypothetical protein